ncbi:hypothetical protein [Nocardia camponoti]|uniref:Uncharacterized protein n=1 Tax=Nocardia camponoti TaxID=1616106 RepID=A0A917Q9V8_9NOCA|nr:hypothetical protein [Nocardia camponoti]GGK38976.1 hypothetical protein GCM10011591_08340 [Nocardia camponoti]
MSANAVAVKVPAGVEKSIVKFVADHGDSATAVLQYVGKEGVRITLVGADGILGDRVVASMDIAKAIVERVNGLAETEHWDRELVSKASPEPGHWKKMAAWVAHQTKFPKARNWKLVERL